jgi:MoaA/NifB/PqqE/SkfB family radical SAM enzyme
MDYIVNHSYITQSDLYVKVLDYSCNKSYELIYKKQIASFTTNGYTPNEDTLETIERSYVKLTLDIMGPKTKDNLIKFFGGHQYLVDNIILFIKSRIDNDEILQMMKNMEDLNKTEKESSNELIKK